MSIPHNQIRLVAAVLIAAGICLFSSSSHLQRAEEREWVKYRPSSSNDDIKALVGVWQSYGTAVNAYDHFPEQIDYSGHYRAEVKGNELVLIWVFDKDTMYNVKGDERVSFYLRFEGRKFTGRKNWDGWPKTWGHVSDDLKELWIYSSDENNTLTRLLKRQR